MLRSRFLISEYLFCRHNPEERSARPKALSKRFAIKLAGHDTQKFIEFCVWWQENGQKGRIRTTKCNSTPFFARRGKERRHSALKGFRRSSLKTRGLSQGMIKNGKKHTKTKKSASQVLTEPPDFDTFAEDIPT